MTSLKSSRLIGASLLGLVSLGGIGYVIWHLVQPRLYPTDASQLFPTAQSTVEATREVLSCTITMAEIDTPHPPLPVYFAANNPTSRIVGHLDNHAFVTVATEQNGWFLIQNPMQGWIPKTQTQNSCNEKVELVKFSPKGGRSAIADRFVGSGSHLYRVPLTQGSTLTVSNTRGVLPCVLDPDGEMFGNPKESQINWTGQIPRTGVYTLEMLSQHKGYRYAFTVSVN